MSNRRGAPAPAVVGSRFVKQYYGEVLSKKPVELHRFYKDESTFCHASGTKEEEPVSGLADIKAKIEHLGLGGATVDLGCGSVDAQPSEGGGVLLMVTGSITIANTDPRQFCQTFFLARQHQDNGRHNYFVRNDIFRFLDVLPEVVQAAVEARDEEEGLSARSTPAVPVVEEAAVEAEPATVPMAQDSSAPQTAIDAGAGAGSPVAAAAAAVPENSSSSMAVGAAPPSESQVAAVAAPATAAAAAPAMGSDPDNGSAGKASTAKPDPSPTSAATTAAAPSSEAKATPAAAAPVAATPPASPLPPAAPADPPAPMTYASLAKSWATVAADSGGGGNGAVGSALASASPRGGGGGGNGNGVAASNGGWGAPEVAAAGAGGTAGMASEHSLGGQSAGPGMGPGSIRPSSASHKGQKGSSAYIPHHASPAVAASAAAAREAAAAGNGEITPATSLFVRKVDMTIDREDMIAHFSAYGEVTGISMNPTRGYAFIDYRSNECVQSALSTKEHYVNRKLLVVEERHSPMQPRNSRGEHGGRGGRNGGRGRGSRDSRDGGDRRSTAGRGGRDRADAPKDGGYKARGRAEPA